MCYHLVAHALYNKKSP